MSNEIMGNTKAELLEWMEGGNKTFGWGALIAMDRSTVNNAFREQYIASFNSNSYMPTISAQAPIVGRTCIMFDQCVLSAPVVSFLDASIIKDTPVANLTMEVMGGRQMSLEYTGDYEARCTELIHVNALNPTILSIQANLEKLATPGAVGAVVVDLKEGLRYDVSSTDSALASQLTGAAFKTQFEAWSDAQRIWKINELVGNEGGLSVEDFEIRSQKAPGSASRAAENYGDGAVVIFVQTVGTPRGQYPSEEIALRYLVPNDDQNKYTVTTVVSKIATLVAASQDLFYAEPGYVPLGFYIIPPELYEETVTFYTGAVQREVKNWGLSGYVWSYSGGGGGAGIWTVDERVVKASLSMVNEDIIFSFDLVAYPENFTIRNAEGVVDDHILVSLTASNKAKVGLSLDINRQAISVASAVALPGTSSIVMDPYKAPLPNDVVKTTLLESLKDSCSSIISRYGNRPTSIALLPLNSLLFQPPYANRLSELHIPHDMIMFGHVAPGAATFEIKTPMVTMGAGRQHPFEITGSNPGVSWTVHNLPGESTPKGSIDTSGRYTAPPKEQISGVQMRVKISATKSGTTSSALVTVVRKEININPLVQFVDYNSSCDLIAGSLGAARTWHVDPAQGTLRDSDVPGRKTFVSPATGTPGVTLELIPITVTSEGVTETAYVGFIHNSPAMVVVPGPIDVAARSIKLTATMTGLEEPDAKWSILAGSGTIDEFTGELVADEFPVEPFVLAQCAFGRTQKGYLLLPLPLAPYPKKPVTPPPTRGANFQTSLILS